MSKKLIQIEHPLIEHKLAFLRDKNTGSAEFRNIIRELTKFLGFEATRDIELEDCTVESPLSKANVRKVTRPPVIVSIMRAGNGMLESMLEVLPFSQSGHIGIYRDKFINNTVEYYFKLPTDVKDKTILLLDPLLATGDTAVASIDRLKQYEVGKIKLLTMLTCPSGVKRVHEFHPDVDIYTLKGNEEINDKGYLVPGIGDAGDRLFGTK
ncbi:MAG: uracil phosphoribosyltransferase [Halobacteriovoraceae bacterium]|nr:uracil phosphoribosyltransferase [Halobacteriovoraceae bacterium]|tara:strand:+ start:325 stop:954 length:630 start_codon:yes stop_codon:yes gene_type:complete